MNSRQSADPQQIAATTETPGNVKGNNKNVFEVDGLPIVVRINTIDQAGNVSETGVSSVAFTGDSRKPKISVIHPASGDHFSALYENERDLGSEFDEFLMPLVVRVDETGNLKELYIYAPGAGRTEADDKVDLLGSDISDTVGRAETSVGDTLAYNTSELLYPNPLENRARAEAYWRCKNYAQGCSDRRVRITKL